MKIEKVWLQIYRGAVPGSTEEAKIAAVAAKIAALPQILREQIGGFLWHGFSSEFTPEKFQKWADMAASFGYLSGAAFGLDDLAPEVKGDRIAKVAALASCVWIMLDAEGAWDQSDDAPKVAKLCTPIKQAAPRKMMTSQSWPVPTLHSQHPYVAFAQYCWFNFNQDYANDFKVQFGQRPYQGAMAWFDVSQCTLVRDVLVPAKVYRPRAATLQAYGWTGATTDLVDALMRWDAQPVVFWCDWWPTDEFWTALQTLAELHARDYYGPTAVWQFQSSTNDLDVDGKCGPKTRAALGVTG